MKLGTQFWKFWGASGVANLSDGMGLIALSLLAASFTSNPELVAGVFVINRLPWLILSLPVGALLDYNDRRATLAIALFFRALVWFALGLLLLGSLSGIWPLYIIALLFGITEVFTQNTFPTLTPRVVPSKEALQTANGRLSAARLAGDSFLGPPAGSFLFSRIAALPFLVAGGAAVIAALLVRALRGNFQPSSTRRQQRLPSEIWEGMGYILKNRLFRTLAGTAALVVLVNRAVFAIFVLYALQVLGLSEAAYGVLMMAFGVGGLIGGLVHPALTRRLGLGTTMLGALVLLGFSYLAIVLIPNPYVVAVFLALSSFTMISWGIGSTSLRQALIPDNLLGRTTGAFRFLSWGMDPLGAALGGLLGKAFGLASPFLLAAAVVWLSVLMALPAINNRRLERTS